MKLIDLLVKELPRRGGWPEECDVVSTNGYGAVWAYKTKGCTSGRELYFHSSTEGHVTRAQYEAALAKNDGWIEWHGGECPVDSDAIVEVRYRKTNPYQYNNDRAGDFYWAHTGSSCDIIAYRLHNPEIKSRANDDRLEQDLNECIGQDVDVQEWSGDGLPPVGFICEGRFPRHPGISFEWQECLVLYVFERECAVKSKSTSTLHYCDEFRPLRTEAERAREDAQTAIRTCLAGTGAGITPMAAKGIYDAIAAGKIPGIKLEGGNGI